MGTQGIPRPAALRPPILGLILATALAMICLAAAIPSRADATGCFAVPSSCGYPDTTNAGVPAGTALTASGSRTVTTNGQVLNGLEITGSVVVAADNVTIRNTRITQTSGGSGTYAVILNNGADNFTIEHSEVSGPNSQTNGLQSAVWNHYGNPGATARADYFHRCADNFTIEHSEVSGPNSQTNGLQSAVWNHYGNPGATARADYFHRCADCWEGSGIFEDDYMVVDAAYNGSHDEDIYVCGDSVDVDHSTLINTHHQTATVFGDTAGCGGNDFDIANSLIAGGGYMVYPQGNAGSAIGTMNIVNNRLARCRSADVYEPSSGGHNCAAGADTSGLYPGGGFYGVAAYWFSGAGNVWSNNIWDDSSKPVCPDGDEGCGVPTPPPVGTAPPAPVPPVVTPPVPVPPVTPAVPVKVRTGSGNGSPAIGGTGTPPVGGSNGAGDVGALAVWHSPSRVASRAKVALVARPVAGAGPIRCTWSVSRSAGDGTVTKRRGCSRSLRAPRRGVLRVHLRLTGSDGRGAGLRRVIRVGGPRPAPIETS